MAKNALQIKVKIVNRRVSLYLKGSQELEDYFRNTETGVSKNWLNADGKGAQYYHTKESFPPYIIVKDTTTGNDETLYLSDMYGDTSQLVDGRYLNVGTLRTVGLSKGVEIASDRWISYEDIKAYADKMSTFVQWLYTNRLRAFVVEADISIAKY